MARRRNPSVEDLLFEQGYLFDFFQAVRLLEQSSEHPQAVGGTLPPNQEAVRFGSHVSLEFPPSAIAAIHKPTADTPMAQMTVTFMGLLGTLGAMPRHYTELVLRHEKESRGKETDALRAWFDLFNHRMLAMFYRAWKKYRFWLAIEKGESRLAEPDSFTRAVTSLVGLGTAGFRDRLRVEADDAGPNAKPRLLAKVDDQAIIYYGGLFAPRVRNAVSLEAILEDYFGLPAQVKQFQEHWLPLDEENRSYLGEAGVNNLLGANTVAGQRVLDVQSRIRVRMGPLTFSQFSQFMPNRASVPEGKSICQWAHLQRLYVGQEFDVDLQLVLKAEETPECRLPESTDDGPQLGWNSWLSSQSFADDRDETMFTEGNWTLA